MTFICINTVATSQHSMRKNIYRRKMAPKIGTFFPKIHGRCFLQPQKIRSYQKYTKRGRGIKKRRERRVQASSRSLTQKLREYWAYPLEGKKYYTTFQIDTRNRCISYYDVQTSICLWKKCLFYVKRLYTTFITCRKNPKYALL